eukprot:TRINITY_DN1357_c0_g1_i4.p1 TRINITY_DN1357_c0_g1~~TRINITY_DN1357_c0_g1_i4.p1  ORF type:complete len:655 (-),score=145.56 TRINITY_DN1357_c0_g1_i4:2-1966(-)
MITVFDDRVSWFNCLSKSTLENEFMVEIQLLDGKVTEKSSYLATKSPVLNKMLYGEMKESADHVVSLEEWTLEQFKPVLDNGFTTNCEKSWSPAMKVSTYKLADYLQIDGLKASMLNSIKNGDPVDALKVLILADACFHELNEFCLKAITIEPMRVLRHNLFVQCSIDVLMCFVKSNYSLFNESELVHALVGWSKYHPDVNMKPIFEHVRLGLLTVDCFKDCIIKSEMVSVERKQNVFRLSSALFEEKKETVLVDTKDIEDDIDHHDFKRRETKFEEVVAEDCPSSLNLKTFTSTEELDCKNGSLEICPEIIQIACPQIWNNMEFLKSCDLKVVKPIIDYCETGVFSINIDSNTHTQLCEILSVLVHTNAKLWNWFLKECLKTKKGDDSKQEFGLKLLNVIPLEIVSNYEFEAYDGLYSWVEIYSFIDKEVFNSNYLKNGSQELLIKVFQLLWDICDVFVAVKCAKEWLANHLDVSGEFLLELIPLADIPPSIHQELIDDGFISAEDSLKVLECQYSHGQDMVAKNSQSSSSMYRQHICEGSFSRGVKQYMQISLKSSLYGQDIVYVHGESSLDRDADAAVKIALCRGWNEIFVCQTKGIYFNGHKISSKTFNEWGHSYRTYVQYVYIFGEANVHVVKCETKNMKDFPLLLTRG